MIQESFALPESLPLAVDEVPDPLELLESDEELEELEELELDESAPIRRQ